MTGFIRALAPLIALTTAVAAADPASCPSDIPLSCHNETVVDNTCCFIPAGQLLQTQFWDTQPVTGPSGNLLPCPFRSLHPEVPI